MQFYGQASCWHKLGTRDHGNTHGNTEQMRETPKSWSRTNQVLEDVPWGQAMPQTWWSWGVQGGKWGGSRHPGSHPVLHTRQHGEWLEKRGGKGTHVIPVSALGVSDPRSGCQQCILEAAVTEALNCVQFLKEECFWYLAVSQWLSTEPKSVCMKWMDGMDGWI